MFAKAAFNDAIIRDTGYVAAHAAKAEIELLQWLVETALNILPVNPQDMFARYPLKRLDEWKFDPNVWLLHVIVGAELLLGHCNNDAERSFDRAMQIDAGKTTSSVWYGVYLFLSGKRTEGLSMARARTRAQPENIWACILHGLFLYIMRDFKGAATAVDEMRTFDRGEAFQDLVRGLICLASGKGDAALRNFESASAMRAEEWSLLQERGYGSPKPERFPGLVILALAKSGRRLEARKRYRALPEQRFVRPIQWAIAHMAMGHHDEAYEAICNAYRGGDLLAHWIWLLPVFDDMNHSEYSRFVQRLRPH